MEESTIKVGDKCRLLKDKVLFEKMQTKYSENIYIVIKVNKNTVDIESDKHILKNIKKSNIIIIKNSYNNRVNFNKVNDEKESKASRRLRREGIADYLKAPYKN